MFWFLTILFSAQIFCCAMMGIKAKRNGGTFLGGFLEGYFWGITSIFLNIKENNKDEV